MNYSRQYNLQLISRNEGKIKSYGSCCDVRAWSHDVRAQDQYLREWMKCDMPFCILPVSLLANFLRTMTCRSRRRVTPKCHPDCKSKILLESICNSCHAVRECLEQDDNFDKYFVEEEIETSHWPCDRCLGALKSIKMFWKIITDKIFGINISKFQEENEPSSCDSVKSIAKVWQNEIIQQALFLKNISPALGRARCTGANASNNSSQKTIRSSPLSNSSKCCEEKFEYIKIPVQIKAHKVAKTTNCSKFHKSTHVVEVGCDTCFIEKENEELNAYKKNLKVLQDKCNVQSMENDRLQEENTSLKIELENVYKGCNWKAAFSRSKCVANNCSTMTQLPKPFESSVDDKCSTNVAKNIDSEMVITLKNCKNDYFKHVSLLQVLHKTNSPMKEDTCAPCPGVDKDPLQILTKVQNTFSAIVKREISIVNNKSESVNNNEVEASFRRIDTRSCRSDPSCSTLSSRKSFEFVMSNDKKFCNTVNV